MKTPNHIKGQAFLGPSSFNLPRHSHIIGEAAIWGPFMRRRGLADREAAAGLED